MAAAVGALRVHLPLRHPPPHFLSSLQYLHLSTLSSSPTLGPPLPLLPRHLLLVLNYSSTSRNSIPAASPSPPPPSLLHLRKDLEHRETPLPLNSDQVEGDEDGQEEESEEEQGLGTQQATDASLPSLTLPELSVKERKELASYAHSLGKKLKSQQVGKSGVTPTVAQALSETLEANELLKIKVHGNCPGELADVVSQIEKATGSLAVGQIGRTVILYRPSLSKMKKTEAKNAQKDWRPKPSTSATLFKMRKKVDMPRDYKPKSRHV